MDPRLPLRPVIRKLEPRLNERASILRLKCKGQRGNRSWDLGDMVVRDPKDGDETSWALGERAYSDEVESQEELRHSSTRLRIDVLFSIIEV